MYPRPHRQQPSALSAFSRTQAADPDERNATATATASSALRYTGLGWRRASPTPRRQRSPPTCQMQLLELEHARRTRACRGTAAPALRVTEGCRKTARRKVRLLQLLRWCSSTPAQRPGLHDSSWRGQPLGNASSPRQFDDIFAGRKDVVSVA